MTRFAAAARILDRLLYGLDPATELGAYEILLGWLGWALARAGQNEAARSVLAELEQRSKSEYVAPLNPAVIASALGEMDKAFELLDEAVRKRTCWICTPRMAFFENFRSDPRFDEHWKRLGYPDQTLRRQS